MYWLGCCGLGAGREGAVRALDYAHCSLHDVPAEVFEHERTLEELLLNSNRLRDLPRPLFLCQELRLLSIADNDVSQLPAAIGQLPHLQLLDARRNVLHDVPADLKACKRLAIVILTGNPLVRLPEALTQLVALQVCSSAASYTPRWRGFQYFHCWTTTPRLHLQELFLSDVELEFLPASVGRLSSLRVLELRDNHLNALPSSMARLKQLVRLDLGHNDFRAWPGVLGALPSLQELWVDLNDLPAVPAWVGNLTALQCLDASSNRVSAIAPEIGSCARLQDLRLSYNELSRLPYTLGRLKELVTLKVSDAPAGVCVMGVNQCSGGFYTGGVLNLLPTILSFGFSFVVEIQSSRSKTMTEIELNARCGQFRL